MLFTWRDQFHCWSTGEITRCAGYCYHSIKQNCASFLEQFPLCVIKMWYNQSVLRLWTLFPDPDVTQGYRSKYPCHQMWPVSIDSRGFILFIFTNIFLIVIVLFTRLFFTWLSSLYQAISLSSKVLRSELSYFRSSHFFSSTVWTTTSDQSFEIIDFKSHSATCAHYITTTNSPSVFQSARSLNQISVSVPLFQFCIG